MGLIDRLIRILDGAAGGSGPLNRDAMVRLVADLKRDLALADRSDLGAVGYELNARGEIHHVDHTGERILMAPALMASASNALFPGFKQLQAEANRLVTRIDAWGQLRVGDPLPDEFDEIRAEGARFLDRTVAVIVATKEEAFRFRMRLFIDYFMRVISGEILAGEMPPSSLEWLIPPE